MHLVDRQRVAASRPQLNGDGKADLVAVSDGNTWVLRSTGTGFLAPTVWSSTPFHGSRATVLGDVNGDGALDLVAVNDTNTYVALSFPLGVHVRSAVSLVDHRLLWHPGNPTGQ
ncbi:MAG: hypothetical protein NVS3B18_08400 [Candidatus Dormibacteria bacterium]